MKTKGILVILFGSLLTLSSCEFPTTEQSLEGEWTCTETSEIFLSVNSELKGTSVFPVYFAQDAMNDNKYYIDNFYQLGSGVQVEIMFSLGTTITIESQTVNGITFSGSGTVNAAANQIDLSYTADDGGGEVDHVTAEYTR